MAKIPVGILGATGAVGPALRPAPRRPSLVRGGGGGGLRSLGGQALPRGLHLAPGRRRCPTRSARAAWSRPATRRSGRSSSSPASTPRWRARWRRRSPAAATPWSPTRATTAWTPTCRCSSPRSTPTTSTRWPCSASAPAAGTSSPTRTAAWSAWPWPWRRCSAPSASSRWRWSTLQALSGAGYPGVASLDIADNVIPYIGGGEEEKIETEPLQHPGHASRAAPSRTPPFAHLRLRAPRGRDATATPWPSSSASRPKATPPRPREALAAFRGEPQERELPTAPRRPIHVLDRRPTGPSRASTATARAAWRCPSAACARTASSTCKLEALVHNTIRGAAGRRHPQRRAAARRGACCRDRHEVRRDLRGVRRADPRAGRARARAARPRARSWSSRRSRGITDLLIRGAQPGPGPRLRLRERRRRDPASATTSAIRELVPPGRRHERLLAHVDAIVDRAARPLHRRAQPGRADRRARSTPSPAWASGSRTRSWPPPCDARGVAAQAVDARERDRHRRDLRPRRARSWRRPTPRRARARCARCSRTARCPSCPASSAPRARASTTTLGRGGSDWSAVDPRRGAARGGDPDLDRRGRHDDRRSRASCRRARVIPEVSFDEAAELAYFGAKVLHPATIKPAVERGHPGAHPELAQPDGAGHADHRRRAGGDGRRAARHRLQEGHLGHPHRPAAHADGLRLRGPGVRGLRPPPHAGGPDRHLRGLDLAHRGRPGAPARGRRTSWRALGEVKVLREHGDRERGRPRLHPPARAWPRRIFQTPARGQRGHDLVRGLGRELLVRGRARPTPSARCALLHREFFEEARRMKVAVVGYGKMGREVEAVLRERGHEPVIVDRGGRLPRRLPGRHRLHRSRTPWSRTSGRALERRRALRRRHHGLGRAACAEVREPGRRRRGAASSTPRTSPLGVNLFYRIVREAARLLAPLPRLRPVHPGAAPPPEEGRAVGHGQGRWPRSSQAAGGPRRSRSPRSTGALADGPRSTSSAVRAGGIVGEHTVGFDSGGDEILLEHRARTRRGFALGVGPGRGVDRSPAAASTASRRSWTTWPRAECLRPPPRTGKRCWSGTTATASAPRRSSAWSRTRPTSAVRSPLRNPIVFYQGHLPAFSFNTLVKKGLGRPGFDARLEDLFARGIDPHESSSRRPGPGQRSGPVAHPRGGGGVLRRGRSPGARRSRACRHRPAGPPAARPRGGRVHHPRARGHASRDPDVHVASAAARPEAAARRIPSDGRGSGRRRRPGSTFRPAGPRSGSIAGTCRLPGTTRCPPLSSPCRPSGSSGTM